MLAPIGTGWLDARDEHGTRKLDLEADWVRSELALALQRKTRVLPILVDGARMPPEQAFQTPQSREIAAVCLGQALPLRRTEFERDLAQLLAQLEQLGFLRRQSPGAGGRSHERRSAEGGAETPRGSGSRHARSRIKPVAIASAMTAIAVLLAVLLLDRRIVVLGQGANGFALHAGQSIDVYVQEGDRARALLCSRPHAKNAPEERLYPFAPLPPAPHIELWERLGTVTFTATHAGRALTLIAITDCVTGAAVDPRSWLRTGQPVRVVFSDGSDQTSSVEVALE